MANHSPVIGLRNALGDLGPLGNVGVGAPGGGRFLWLASAAAAALVDGVRGSSICPGAVKGMLICLISRRSWITRLLMILGVAPDLERVRRGLGVLLEVGRGWKNLPANLAAKHRAGIVVNRDLGRDKMRTTGVFGCGEDGRNLPAFLRSGRSLRVGGSSKSRSCESQMVSVRGFVADDQYKGDGNIRLGLICCREETWSSYLAVGFRGPILLEASVSELGFFGK